MRCASGSLEKQQNSSNAPQQQMPSSLTNSFTDTSSSQYAEMNYPLFSFSRGRCLQHEGYNEMSDSLYKPLQRQLQQINNDQAITPANNDDDSETEEFVLL